MIGQEEGERHPGGMGCTDRAITLVYWKYPGSSSELGFEVALQVPVLCCGSSDPKLTALEAKSPVGRGLSRGDGPDAELTVHGLPGRTKGSEQKVGNCWLQVGEAGWLL